MAIKRAANQLKSIHARRKDNADRLKNKEYKSKNSYRQNKSVWRNPSR